MLQAILDGVNELREKAVTHEDLQKYHKLQSEELALFVKAETEPLHAGIERLGENLQQLAKDAQQTRERLAAIEAQDRGASSSSAMSLRTSPHDPGFKRLTFRGLDDKANPYDRIDAIEKFMKQHFPRVKLVTVENHYKSDFRNKKHELSKAAFIEFTSPVVREQVFDIIKANESGSHKFSFNGKDVSIARGLSEVAVARNGTLKAAKGALENDPRTESMTTKIVWESRSVTVGGVCAFKQGERDLGQFVAPFEHVSLPVRKR